MSQYSTYTQQQPWAATQHYGRPFQQPSPQYSHSTHGTGGYDPSMAALTTQMANHTPFGTSSQSHNGSHGHWDTSRSAQVSRQGHYAEQLVRQLEVEVHAVDVTARNRYSDSAHTFAEGFCQQIEVLRGSSHDSESAVMQQMQTAYCSASRAVSKCKPRSARA